MPRRTLFHQLQQSTAKCQCEFELLILCANIKRFNWRHTCQLPRCRFERVVGTIGDLESETEIILPLGAGARWALGTAAGVGTWGLERTPACLESLPF